MASKATMKRQKSANMVIAAGETYKTMIAKSMGRLYGEDIVPAAVLLLEKVVKDLADATADMIQMDDAHERELDDDPALRERRDIQSEKLHSRLVLAKIRLETIFGSTYVARLGFKGITPEDPVEVHRLARVVAENLSEINPPESSIPGYIFDPTTWQAPIIELIDGLEESLTTVAQEAHQAQTSLAGKRQAIETYDQAFACTANMVSTMLQVAGEKDLAKSVRPSTRRTGQTMEIADEHIPETL